MKTSRVRKGAALAAELVASLLLVAGAYFLFLQVLGALFPSGTPLRELIPTGAPSPERPRGRERGAEATLARLMRDVRCRRGTSVAWGSAREGMPLFNQDAVQTFDRSGAAICFDPHNLVELGSNSLVLVKRVGWEDREGPRRYRVQVQGDLWGAVSAKNLRLELETAGHLARIGKGGALFRLARVSAKVSALSVYTGEAEVAVPGGRLRIPAEHGVTLKEGVAVPTLRRLPSSPELDEGRNGLFRYRIVPPKLRFSWRGPEGEYRFQLSRRENFREPILDLKLRERSFATAELDRGGYLWRVSRIEEGREGRFSPLGRVRLEQSLVPPPLSVSFPDRISPAGRYLLQGSSEAGSRIFVDGKEIPTGAGGEFSQELRLEAGVNLIRVEALDLFGNASYASRIVYGRNGRPNANEQGGVSP